MYDVFLELVRLGLGHDLVVPNDSKTVNWKAIKTLADTQGLTAVVLDGIDKYPPDFAVTLPIDLKLEWIGGVVKGEQMYALQHEVAKDMGNLFHNNGIRTYVLKGDVIAECYPKPNHRVSVDFDCYLLPENGWFDAWRLGNDLIKGKNFPVYTDFYKNSTFDLPGLIVENHRYLVPFRGNERLMALEKLLETMIGKDNREDRFDGEWLYRPPVLVTALFLIEHAYSHFLHEGLTLRMVLDWVLFSEKHKSEIDWSTFDALVEEFGFRMFYDSFSRLGTYLMGDSEETEKLTKRDKKMLGDIWAPLDVHDTVRGWKGKSSLAGNTWRARWKYRYFTELDWMKALWIQVKGFLFEKDPILS